MYVCVYENTETHSRHTHKHTAAQTHTQDASLSENTTQPWRPRPRSTVTREGVWEAFGDTEESVARDRWEERRGRREADWE